MQASRSAQSRVLPQLNLGVCLYRENLPKPESQMSYKRAPEVASWRSNDKIFIREVGPTADSGAADLNGF